MTVRTVRHLRRSPSQHTEWCAQDHRCGMNEHRSDEMVVNLPGVGRVALTRVLHGDREYAEVRGQIVLHPDADASRWQLGTMMAGLREVLARTRLAGFNRGPVGSIDAPRGSALTTAGSR